MRRARTHDEPHAMRFLSGSLALWLWLKHRMASVPRLPGMRRLPALRRQGLSGLRRMKSGPVGQVLTEAVYPPLVYATVVASFLTFGGWFAGRLVDQVDPAARILLWAVPLTVLGVTVAVDLAYVTLSVRRRNRGVPACDIRYLGWKAASWRSSGGRRRGPRLTRLDFASSQGLPRDGDSPPQVAPHVSFYAMPRRELVFEAQGRWVDSDHAARPEDTGGERSLRTTVPAGIPLPLDIVAKRTEDDYCYALAGDHPGRPAADWRDEERKLKPGLYSVRVRVVGRRTSEAFWFLLVNLGRGERVQVVDYDARHGGTPTGF